jgi:hypothetical protein
MKEGDIIQITREKVVNRNSPQKPSSTAISSVFHNQQVVSGRSFAFHDSVPITLLHPVFLQFVKNTWNILLTPGDNTLAMDLAVAMVALHPDESMWAESICSVLETHEVHLKITKMKTAQKRRNSRFFSSNRQGE